MICYNVGRREVGKTTLALYLIRKAQYKVIFDPRGLVPADTRISGHEWIIAAFNRWYDQPERAEPIVVTPEHSVQSQFETTSREVKRWIKSGDHVAYMVDEVLQVDLQPTDQSDDFDWILRLCPTRQALIVMTGHRPTDVPVNIRAICDWIVLFHMTQQHDLESVRKRCGDHVAAILPKLGPYQYVLWDDRTATYTINKNSGDWKIPLRDRQASIKTAIEIPNIAGSNDEQKLF